MSVQVTARAEAFL